MKKQAAHAAGEKDALRDADSVLRKSNDDDQFKAVICKHAKICWEDTDFFFRRMKIIWVWVLKCSRAVHCT